MKNLLIAILLSSWFLSCNNTPSAPEDLGPKEIRTLYLVRHAKIGDEDSLALIDRSLGRVGKEDAILIGKQLTYRGVILDRILSSTAKHCKGTAKRIGEELGFTKDSIVLDSTIFKCQTIDLLNAIRSTDSKYKSLLVVAHNPALIQAANHFQQDTIFMDMPVGGVIAIEFNASSWKGLANKDGKYLFFDYPKLYRLKESE